MADGLWTIDELSAMVADALADCPGPSSGRVREVPDRRTIRWYTTIGILDAPTARRGRTAFYGRRHLLQLVAIKRMQVDGLSLTAIQERLYGATDTTLDRIARLDTHGDAPAPRPAPAPSVAPPVAPTPAGTDARPAGRFWAAPLPEHPAPQLVHGIRLDGTADGVTLVLPPGARVPDADDLAAIHEAAGALLTVLHRRGLTVQRRDNP